MANEVETIDVGTDHGPIIRLLLAIRGSFNLFVISLGVVTVLTSIVLELIDEPVVAALMMVWGVSAVLLGLFGLAFMKAIGYY